MKLAKFKSVSLNLWWVSIPKYVHATENSETSFTCVHFARRQVANYHQAVAFATLFWFQVPNCLELCINSRWSITWLWISFWDSRFRMCSWINSWRRILRSLLLRFYKWMRLYNVVHVHKMLRYPKLMRMASSPLNKWMTSVQSSVQPVSVSSA